VSFRVVAVEPRGDACGCDDAIAVTGQERHMRLLNRVLGLMLLPACWAVSEARAGADDIQGIWASDARLCSKIFVKKGNSFVMAKNADIYGSGFIIDGRKIRGKAATCNIKTIKEDGPVVHMIAACASDVMLSDAQLSVRVVDHNRVVRIFPGVSDMEMGYERCDLK
jgi:hypothetical protein